MVGIKYRLIAVMILILSGVNAQVTEGKIIFERKTNLEKKFNDSRMAEMIKNNKVKVELFEMYFNEQESVFKPIPTDEVDQLSWATTKNTVYQNIATNDRMSILDLMGNKVFVKDTLEPRVWKITDSKRNLAGYECTKAVWQKDDSTRIYAWFAPGIVPSVGPEMFTGLPGAILGLATEDGGIIYFAKEVKAMNVPPETFEYKVGKNDVYSVEGLRKDLMERFGKQPWGKGMVNDLFRWF